uniref:uncharacterized protein LOC122578072 n=1 Tax=Erigeron canadensis TaxID=72917 RepID=UPI001CB92BB1|nr:uncharacterized protein LOC122578072 [Erigeron canadensis]
MGTKRPFDEDLQEFFKHPKHIESENKPDFFGEDKSSFEAAQNVVVAGEGVVNCFREGDHEEVNALPDSDKTYETNASLPMFAGISCHEDVPGPGVSFCSNLFPELFEFNLPRRQVVHYDDTYASLLNCSPRKEVPLGPEHQADISEFDSDSARKYNSDPDKVESLMGICVIPNQEGEILIYQTDCKCLDGGSIRCVQQHANEARLNLKDSLGFEKFVNLGFNNIGEEVASNWTEEEEKLFQDVVYSNPVSHGKRFWDELSIAFRSRTKKELVSYYFNVFVLRRRAVQNRSKLLAIDSDDDEWWGSKRGPSEVIIEDQDFHVVGPLVDHIDHDFQSEDGDHDDNVGADGDIVIGLKDGQNEVNECSLSNINDAKATSNQEQEKHFSVYKGHNGGLRSESYLHWDPPYSTMGSAKGVDLLPTCSMIEEIFGSSKTGKSS